MYSENSFLSSAHARLRMTESNLYSIHAYSLQLELREMKNAGLYSLFSPKTSGYNFRNGYYTQCIIKT